MSPVLSSSGIQNPTTEELRVGLLFPSQFAAPGFFCVLPVAHFDTSFLLTPFIYFRLAGLISDQVVLFYKNQEKQH